MVANRVVRFFRHFFIARKPVIRQLEVTNIIVKSVPCLFIYWDTKNVYWLHYTTGKPIPVKTKGLLIIRVPLATDKIDIVAGNSWFSVKRTFLLKTVDINAASRDFLLTDIKQPVYPSVMNGGRRVAIGTAKLVKTNFRTVAAKQKTQFAPPRLQLKMPSFSVSKIVINNHTYPAK